ncbi:MAG: helix-turn-helix transcriptional regulator [Alphaproteobacteria bacterium]|nr:helix-turn-helix transcriptional regulator [Alphaproteobacteria bacterium]
MTPFGEKIRAIRAERGISLKDMAAGVGVSPAYLSALEHGHRGQPTWYLVQRIIGFFNIIWDEAEELEKLAGVSHPRIVVDTAGLSPKATELANMLAQNINRLDGKSIAALLELLRQEVGRASRTR